MTQVVDDAGAADGDDRDFWADRRVRWDRGTMMLGPAGVVAQVSRSARQVPLRRLLRGCDVAGLDEDGAHRVGRPLAVSRTCDVVEAHVVVVAPAPGAVVVTSDRGDIEHLLAGAGSAARVVDVR